MGYNFAGLTFGPKGMIIQQSLGILSDNVFLTHPIIHALKICSEKKRLKACPSLYYSSAVDMNDPLGRGSVFDSMAVVSHDGTVLWIPVGRLKASCLIDIRRFPLDSQICFLRFGSWTYNGNQVIAARCSDQAIDYSGQGWHRAQLK